MNRLPALLELRGVGHRFVDGATARTVLTGIDLSIDRGEVLVVLGRSGSGKTTLLNVLSALETPSEGEAYLSREPGTDPLPLHQLGETQRTHLRRHAFGFVFQQYNLIPTLTVLENAALCARLCGFSDAYERARQGLALVGLEGRADAWPEQLSGGEQQRVAVVRAIAHSPLVVVADEPTGSLDGETATQVMDLLVAQTRSKGASLVLATHFRDFAERADQVLELRS